LSMGSDTKRSESHSSTSSDPEADLSQVEKDLLARQQPANQGAPASSAPGAESNQSIPGGWTA
ncbi:hypothetical protein LPJ57_007505, partial [Coemansia sp. RSA 486]